MSSEDNYRSMEARMEPPASIKSALAQEASVAPIMELVSRIHTALSRVEKRMGATVETVDAFVSRVGGETGSATKDPRTAPGASSVVDQRYGGQLGELFNTVASLETRLEAMAEDAAAVVNRLGPLG